LNGDHAPAPASNSDSRRVLHIEDNLSNLKLIERIFEQRPEVEVVAAMHGSLGLELAREHRPSLILLDLHLPDITGEEVLHRLREDPITAAIPVVIVSADATPGQVQRLLASGATAYITKPIDVRDLLDAYERALGR
jgi:CheY-like chemotaxis protein